MFAQLRLREHNVAQRHYLNLLWLEHVDQPVLAFSQQAIKRAVTEQQTDLVLLNFDFLEHDFPTTKKNRQLSKHQFTTIRRGGVDN